MAKTIRKGDIEYDNMYKAMDRNRANLKVLVPFTYQGVEWLSRMENGQELVFTERYPQQRPPIIDAMYGSSIRDTDAGVKEAKAEVQVKKTEVQVEEVISESEPTEVVVEEKKKPAKMSKRLG